MKNVFKIVTFLLILLMVIPSVLATDFSANKIVVVGSIDSQLGFDEIVTGTTTFIVARKPKLVEKTGYHNVTKFEWNNMTYHSYDVTVPDPSGIVTIFSNMVFKCTGWNPKSKVVIHPDGTTQSILHVKGQADGDSYARYLVV